MIPASSIIEPLLRAWEIAEATANYWEEKLAISQTGRDGGDYDHETAVNPEREGRVETRLSFIFSIFKYFHASATLQAIPGRDRRFCRYYRDIIRMEIRKHTMRWNIRESRCGIALRSGALMKSTVDPSPHPPIPFIPQSDAGNARYVRTRKYRSYSLVNNWKPREMKWWDLARSNYAAERR